MNTSVFNVILYLYEISSMWVCVRAHTRIYMYARIYLFIFLIWGVVRSGEWRDH